MMVVLLKIDWVTADAVRNMTVSLKLADQRF